MHKINLTNTDAVRGLFPKSRFVRDVSLFLYTMEMNGYPPGETYVVKWKAVLNKGTVKTPDECELVVLTDEKDLGLLAGLALAFAREKSDSMESVTVHNMSLFFVADDEDEEDPETPAEPKREKPDSDFYDSDNDSDASLRVCDCSTGKRARERSLSPPAKRRRHPPTVFHGDVYSRPGGRFAFKENPDLARDQLRRKLATSST